MLLRRPKARKIPTADDASDDECTAAPVVVRPKPKKRGSSRLSFGGADEDGADSAAFTAKKSALSRKAIERNAQRAAESAVVGREAVGYSKEYLEELKRAQAVVAEAEAEGATVVEDVDMGTGITDDDVTPPPPVPMETEIPDAGIVKVMKQRRAERAEAEKLGARDFISLNEDTSDKERSGELVLRSKRKKETRLVHVSDDEDIANYVEPTETLLLSTSRKAKRAAEQKRKAAIREVIDDAESDSSVSEFEKHQIRAGVFSESVGGPKGFEAELEAMARNPPAVGQLPDIGDVLRRLEGRMKEVEARKKAMERQVEMLMAEKSEIREREQLVQKRLDEVGKRFAEMGVQGGGEGAMGGSRGLESFGNTPIRMEE